MRRAAEAHQAALAEGLALVRSPNSIGGFKGVVKLVDHRREGHVSDSGLLPLKYGSAGGTNAKKFQAIGKWAGTLGTLQQAVLTKLA